MDLRGHEGSPDGRRFLAMAKVTPAPGEGKRLVCMQNWTALLKKHAGEWANGLHYWRGYAGSMRTRRDVVDGGDTIFVRSGVRVLAWREADKAAIEGRTGPPASATHLYGELFEL